MRVSPVNVERLYLTKMAAVNTVNNIKSSRVYRGKMGCRGKMGNSTILNNLTILGLGMKKILSVVHEVP